MWKTIELDGFKIQMKVYETGSEYGIEKGRISKLNIREIGKTMDLANYDRGWDTVPQNLKVIEAYNKVLKMYN